MNLKDEIARVEALCWETIVAYASSAELKVELMREPVAGDDKWVMHIGAWTCNGLSKLEVLYRAAMHAEASGR